MRAAVVGCGLMGRKRAAAHEDCDVVICVDVVKERAAALARTIPGAEFSDDWRPALKRPDIDLVIVSTVPDSLAAVATAAVRAGKHVLVEKPAARNARELRALERLAGERGACVKVGFNHRHHPAILKAKELVDAGALGPLMFVRGRYGHGGRPGYAGEWRADPKLSGGGELVDQGMHLIDLARWFLGEFTDVFGRTATKYWDMPVEDNAFLCLTTPSRQIAWLHAGWTEWKNIFSFEIFGKTGKLQIDGLGGSYGPEKLTWFRMPPEMGPPGETTWEYPGPDRSFAMEFEELRRAVEEKREPMGGLKDARAALEIVGRVYGGRT